MLLQQGPEDQPLRPREAHPAFYGAYDWHSAVEMHWVLVRLMRLVPEKLDVATIRQQLDRHLAPQCLETEARNLLRSERPYGFGWALMLANELATWDDADATRWSGAMEPLVDRIVDSLSAWLEIAEYPVRSGMHGNSAFALSLALRSVQQRAPELARAIEATARRWFSGDTDYPGRYEPSGTDFLSPALTEAELMSQVLDPAEFFGWFGRFLPDLADGEPRELFTPVGVSDPTDGQIAHLHGLNLSRAWCWKRLAECLPPAEQRLALISSASEVHAEASLSEAAGSDYMVEHWLAAYAVLLTSP